MNKTTHTPGPWARRSIPGHLFELTHEDAPVLRIRGGTMPTLADANLIAAAPDLLADTKDGKWLARAVVDSWERGNLADAVSALREWADDRAAIAKAEGASCPRCGDSGRIVVGYGGTTGISPFFAPCDCAKAEGGQS